MMNKQFLQFTFSQLLVFHFKKKYKMTVFVKILQKSYRYLHNNWVIFTYISSFSHFGLILCSDPYLRYYTSYINKTSSVRASYRVMTEYTNNR